MHFHIHTKPPSGQGLTLTLKGLCLAPVIATPQAGFCCEHIYVLWHCVFMSMGKRVWNHNTWGELLQTPSAPGADCRIGFVCPFALWFVSVWTTEKQRQLHQQCSERQNNCAFDGVLFVVVVGRQEMRSCSLALCVRAGLIKERGRARRRIPITY